MGESGNTWELVKSNDLSTTKGSLYKGMGADRAGFFFFFLGFEREKRREKVTQEEREREREREEEKRKKMGKHSGDESTKRAEKVRNSIKREKGVELETIGIPKVGRFWLCLKQNLSTNKLGAQIHCHKSNIHRFGEPQLAPSIGILLH